MSSAVLGGGGVFSSNTSSLNGVDQLYTLDTTTFSGATEATISMWARFTSLPSDSRLFYEGTSSAAFSKILLRTQGSNLSLGMRDAPTGTFKQLVATGVGLVINTWYNIVGVIDTINNKIILYVDGVQVGTTTITMSAIDNSTPIDAISMGRGNDDEFVMGSLAFPRFWTRVLTPAEIVTQYNIGDAFCFSSLSPSLKVDLDYSARLANFDGNTGDELVDQSTSGITTTPINTPTYADVGLLVDCT